MNVVFNEFSNNGIKITGTFIELCKFKFVFQIQKKKKVSVSNQMTVDSRESSVDLKLAKFCSLFTGYFHSQSPFELFFFNTIHTHLERGAIRHRKESRM